MFFSLSERACPEWFYPANGLLLMKNEYHPISETFLNLRRNELIHNSFPRNFDYWGNWLISSSFVLVVAEEGFPGVEFPNFFSNGQQPATTEPRTRKQRKLDFVFRILIFISSSTSWKVGRYQDTHAAKVFSSLPFSLFLETERWNQQQQHSRTPHNNHNKNKRLSTKREKLSEDVVQLLFLLAINNCNKYHCQLHSSE